MQEVDIASQFTADKLVGSQKIVELVGCKKSGSVAFTLKQYFVDQKKGTCNLYHHNADDMQLTQITRSPLGKQTSTPQFITDFGLGVVNSTCFMRDGQVWMMPIAGGEAQQITSFPLDVECYRVFINEFDQIWMLVVMDVYMDKSIDETVEIDKSISDSGTSGVEYDSLMVRHW